MDKFTSDQVHNSIQILRTDTTKGSTHIFYNAIENQIDSATIQTDQWYYTKKQNHILISTDKNILMNDFKKENPLYSQLNPLIRSINSSKAATHLYIHSKHQNTPFEKLFGDQWKRSFSVGQLWISNQLHRTIRSPEFQ